MNMWWIAGAAGLFVAAEFLIRMRKRSQSFWENDSELGHRLRANKKGVWKSKEFSCTAETNSDGFFDGDFSSKKGRKRIFVLGSSYVEALQVPREKNVTYLLERKLKDASVFNFSVSSYGPLHHLLLLKKYGPKYRPDVVVFTYLIGNDVKNVNPDIEESKNRPFPVLKDGKLEITPPLHYSTSLPRIARLLKKSRIMSELVLRLQNAQKKNKAPLRFRAYEKNNPDFMRGYELGEVIIREAKNVAENLGSKFLLVVIPPFLELDPQWWERTKARYPELKDVEMDFEYPAKRMEAFCKKEYIDCLLLRHAFIDYLKKHGKLPMFEEDSHWNEAGHELAATAIAQKLSECFK